jgi:hypothetical protein
MAQLAAATDPGKQGALLGSAQTIIAENSPAGFLFRLA